MNSALITAMEEQVNSNSKKMTYGELSKKLTGGRSANIFKLIAKGEEVIKFGKAVSGPLNAALIGFGTYVDYHQNIDMTLGEALMKNVAGAGASAIGFGGAVIGLSALGGLPAVGVFGIAIATGTALYAGHSFAYDNLDWYSDSLDWTGRKVDDFTDWAGGKVDDIMNWTDHQLDMFGQSINQNVENMENFWGIQ